GEVWLLRKGGAKERGTTTPGGGGRRDANRAGLTRSHQIIRELLGQEIAQQLELWSVSLGEPGRNPFAGHHLPSLHCCNDLFGDGRRIFRDRQLRENRLQRRARPQLSQPLDGVIGDDFPFVQDHHFRTDLLHHLQYVGTVQNYFAFSRKSSKQIAQNQSCPNVQAGKRFIQNKHFRVVQ